MESELFSEISSDYYVQRFKINDEWTGGRNATIHAECFQNAEKVNEHFYFLELYLSVDDFGFRDFLLGVSFGTEIMDKEELDAEINSWIGQTITDEMFQSQIETYLKAAEAQERILLHDDVLESYANVDKKPGESSDRQEDICPICGGGLDFEEDVSLNDFSQPDGTLYKWSCPNCGATGMAGFCKTFDRHYNVLDGDGNPFDGTVGEPT